MLGRIEGIHVTGATLQTDRGIQVRLWRVEVKPECEIKGQFQETRLTYYLYNYAPGLVQNGEFEWLQKGQRRIFFLVRDGATTRSVSDLYATSVPYPRGDLPNILAYKGSPASENIARILLTPSASEKEHEFASTIPQVTRYALRAAGYAFVASQLVQMAHNGSTEIEREVCLTAYEQMFGSEACIKDIEAGDISRGLAQRVARARERRALVDSLVAEATGAGRESPLAHWTSGVERDDPSSVRGLFEFLSHNSDPIVRASADQELRRPR
jgi:hypothetical protein